MPPSHVGLLVVGLLGCSQPPKWIPFPDVEGAEAYVFVMTDAAGGTHSWVGDPSNVTQVEIPAATPVRIRALTFNCSLDDLGLEPGPRTSLDHIVLVPLPSKTLETTIDGSTVSPWSEAPRRSEDLAAAALAENVSECPEFEGTPARIEGEASPVAMLVELGGESALLGTVDERLYLVDNGTFAQVSTSAASLGGFRDASDTVWLLGWDGAFGRYRRESGFERLPRAPLGGEFTSVSGSPDGSELFAAVQTAPTDSIKIGHYRDRAWTLLLEVEGSHEVPGFIGIVWVGEGEAYATISASEELLHLVDGTVGRWELPLARGDLPVTISRLDEDDVAIGTFQGSLLVGWPGRFRLIPGPADVEATYVATVKRIDETFLFAGGGSGALSIYDQETKLLCGTVGIGPITASRTRGLARTESGWIAALELRAGQARRNPEVHFLTRVARTECRE